MRVCVCTSTDSALYAFLLPNSPYVHLVAHEPIRPGLRLEVPDHEARVHGASGQMLHVRVE